MPSVRAILRTIAWSARRDGIRATLRKMIQYAMTGLDEADHDPEFDRTYGTETDGIIMPAELDVEGPNARFGTRYEATTMADFFAAMEAAAVDAQRFTFVDLGSGKGKVLLLASTFPFKRIVGVEHSPSLCRVARENIEGFRHADRKCSDVDVVCGDATSFEFPEGPLVIYMFNPFREPVMTGVLDNLRRSLARSPRELHVIYQKPLLGELLARQDFLETAEVAGSFAIYTGGTVGNEDHQAGTSPPNP